MWTPGLGELLIIFAIVLVLFGGGKLAGVGKSLGTAMPSRVAFLPNSIIPSAL